MWWGCRAYDSGVTSKGRVLKSDAKRQGLTLERPLKQHAGSPIVSVVVERSNGASQVGKSDAPHKTSGFAGTAEMTLRRT